MRTIEDHKVNPANDTLTITVLDEPGSGGAQHLYQITGFSTASNPSDPFTARHGQPAQHSTVLFQNGPIAEVGVNGVTHEALLAIVADRLRYFHCTSTQRQAVFMGRSGLAGPPSPSTGRAAAPRTRCRPARRPRAPSGPSTARGSRLFRDHRNHDAVSVRRVPLGQ